VQVAECFDVVTGDAVSVSQDGLVWLVPVTDNPVALRLAPVG